MKRIYKLWVLLIGILVINTTLSCENKIEDEEPKYELGLFEGTVGRHLFSQENTISRTVIRREIKVNEEKIKIDLDGSGGENEINKFTIKNRIEFNLNNPETNKVYNEFDKLNTISLSIDEGYTEIKNKVYKVLNSNKEFEIKVIDYNKKLYIKGTIKGYLHNINDLKDSVLVSANFSVGIK